jgi:hypothetical protein
VVQAGGVVAFAAAVWLELRVQRKTIEKLAGMVYSILERDRMRHGDTGPVRALPQSDPPPFGR